MSCRLWAKCGLPYISFFSVQATGQLVFFVKVALQATAKSSGVVYACESGVAMPPAA